MPIIPGKMARLSQNMITFIVMFNVIFHKHLLYISFAILYYNIIAAL